MLSSRQLFLCRWHLFVAGARFQNLQTIQANHRPRLLDSRAPRVICAAQSARCIAQSALRRTVCAVPSNCGVWQRPCCTRAQMKSPATCRRPSSRRLRFAGAPRDPHRESRWPDAAAWRLPGFEQEGRGGEE
eukprot:3606195-Pleurochrysis_carterae.AAC.2